MPHAPCFEWCMCFLPDQFKFHPHRGGQLHMSQAPPDQPDVPAIVTAPAVAAQTAVAHTRSRSKSHSALVEDTSAENLEAPDSAPTVSAEGSAAGAAAPRVPVAPFMKTLSFARPTKAYLRAVEETQAAAAAHEEGKPAWLPAGAQELPLRKEVPARRGAAWHALTRACSCACMRAVFGLRPAAKGEAPHGYAVRAGRQLASVPGRRDKVQGQAAPRTA
jgi:hypothetical protein